VTAVTDERGRYRLDGLAKGPRYSVRASTRGQDYLPAQESAADTDGLTPVKVDLGLVKGIRVRGRVTDKATGKPVPAALWYHPLKDNKHFADIPGNEFYTSGLQGFRTDAGGSYSLLVLPGAGVLTFRAEVEGENPYTQVVLDPAHRERAYNDAVLEDAFLSVGDAITFLRGQNAYRLIEPEPGAEPLTIDVTFERGKEKRVQVVGPDGKPVEGAVVSGWTAFGGRTTAKGDTFTAVALDPARPRTLTVVHTKRKLAGHVTLRGDEKGPVTVTLRPWATLTGKLLDEDGKPLAGARVRIGYREESAFHLAHAGIPVSEESVQTDAEGNFRVETVFPGMRFGLVFLKGGSFRDIGRAYERMTLAPSETKDLGTFPSKVYQVE
jgi:hypothetical protein